MARDRLFRLIAAGLFASVLLSACGGGGGGGGNVGGGGDIPPPAISGSGDKDNKPPPPEIMKADSDSPLSSQEQVLAATESGAALLTVTVSNGGELLPFSDANGFSSEGGSVAVISLSRAAAALFTADGLVMSLILTATNAGGTVLSTVSFASSALGIDGAGLTLHLTTALLRSETELFAATDASLTIWHNGDKEEKYELSGLGWDLFTVGADGGVSVVDDLPVSGEGAFYGLTLRLTDGAADAERLLSLRLTPPLPEIEGVSGETKLVDALSGSGTALLAVTVSNGGALSPFADANGFASDGGAVAVISLARSATALFTRDGLTLSLALTATNAGGTVSATVSFVSSALGIDGAGLFASFATAMLPSETEVFAAADARLTIWHNDNKQETYELSGVNANLFAVDVNGGVRTASDLSSSEDDLLYELTLRLTDGAAVAERLLTLALLPPPIAVDVEVECAGQWPCRDQFAAALSAAIESGDATLNHERAMALDQSPGHGNIVASTFRIYGSGASVRLTVIDRFRGGSSAVTSVVFAKLPAKKKLIIAHSISNLIASAETMREKEAIVAQSTGNIGKDDPTYYYNSSGYFPDDVVQGSIRAEKLLDTGLMAIVGGIAKVSEVPAAGVAHSAYCATGKPHITLDGVDYCSVYNRCGWTANYCLVAPAFNVLYDAETGAREHGTSLAGPQAAAALQMLAAMWPDLSQTDLVALLLELADDIGEPGIDPVYGHGRLSFRRLYEPGGLSPFIAGGEAFRFSCDADSNTCQKSPIENVDSENEENKQPPEIIKADSDSPLSSQEPVLAAAESGTALLTVTISNGGALLSFADTNGFASEGGAVAVISLARPAAALFTLDGLTLSLALTATNAGGTVSETVSFASSARGFDGLGLSLHLTTALLRPETELFAATDSRLTIWHNDGKEENYELSGLDSQLFATDADGGVRVAGDLPVSGKGVFYGLTLRLTDGAAIAERLLFLRLTPPLPEIEGVSGETKLVDALSGSGTALLAVTVSNGGALLSFADANGFASGGGAVAVISLARPATALFTLDGLTLSLALTATNAGGTVSEVVSFASSARGFDGLELSLHLTTALLYSATELFAATDANLTIWHNGGKEESYELSGLDSELFAAGADGGVRVAGDLPVSGKGVFYGLTLRLTDGAAIAERLLFLRLTPPLPEIEGELLGETKLVDALSGSGTALLTVTVSNGELSPFADANGFASDGGAVAVISLARSATVLFTLDNLTLSLALTATSAVGTVSATVSFASSSRGFDGAGLFASFATVILPSETEVFAAADARLTIWHNDNAQETYELSGEDASLFAVDVNGGVRTASDLSSSEDDLLYELTLRLTDGAAVAERLLTLALLPPPIAVDVEVECTGQWPCRDQFAAALSAAIESGDATLDHERAIVLDASPGHGDIVASAFRTYGSGASVRLTVIDRGRGGPSAVTSVVFAKLPAKKKLIVAHSVGDFIASAETMKEKEAIVAQAAGNVGLNDPSYYYNSSGFFPDDVVQGSIRAEKILELGLMAIIGGIAKVSEVPATSDPGLPYCATGKPHITLEGVDYCSVYNRCGWTANYCLVAPAENVIYDAETGARDGGTSLAAPQAAAALQMLAAMWPDLSQTDLVALLLELADDIGEPGIDPVYGHGRLSFRRLYEPGGLSPFIAGGEAFRFSCDADSNTCQKSPIENVDSENEENKQRPEIIKADSDSPLSSQEPVLAAAESGTALLTVTISNGGALSPFADTNGFASDGGAVAMISLARSATALFTLDNLTLSLALTATNAGGTVSETVSFASSARGFDGLGLSLHLTTALLGSGTELFAATDARLTIWHNDGKEENYKLSGLDSQLFAADADGGVRVASDLPVSGEGAFYELTLRLTDGAAIAERLLFLRLTPPLPEIEGVSGETKLVDALSGSGTALLAVTVSNGGELLSFAGANGFASGGGAVAVISLARSATALFTLDGLTLSLALTATNAGGTVSETVSFASSARGFDGLELSLHLTTALLRPETELFAATDSRLTIWHNDGKEESYELSGLDSQLFAAGADGGARVASDLPVSGEGAFYELTLRLTDGAAIAERLLFLRLTPPLPEIEGVSGETKLVNALSGSGTALLAVTVSNGGALSSFADANGFASDGGAVAVISLARSATALFTLDGLTLSLALTATNAGGTVSATVSFASSALGINGAGLFVSFATAMLPSETEVFAAADARLTIWHNDNAQETYELSGTDASLFAVDVNGGVRTASDLSSSEDDLLYELTLRLTDGAAIAERLLTLALLPPPIAVDVEVECAAGQWPCRDQFAAALSAAIESGEATLDHERAMVLDASPGHGDIVASAFRTHGSGASVRLTVIDSGRGGPSAVTSVVFAKLPAKKKLIVAHSISDLIASAETMKEKEAVVAQSAGNIGLDYPTYYYNSSSFFPDDVVQGSIRAEKILELGLMAVVGGIAKVSEVPAAADPGIAYCATGKPHITLDGVDYCSVYDRCGWTANYCLVTPAFNVLYDAETGAREHGTSLAGPQAAAALQMLATMWPDLSQTDLVALLLELADDIGEPGIDPVYGHGRLSFRRLYEPGGLSPFIAGGEAFRFSCDADSNTCQKSPIENVDSENEENKQPPEIIKADSDSPLSPQKPVLAAAESGTALLTVTVSNGELSPFADANGFASEGGAVAVISLARSATALFTLDGLTLSLALTATNAGGTVSATVSFVSSALGIDGAGLFASFATVMLPSETEVFAAADARLTIWHNGDKQETYELSGTDASLFAVDVNGGVRTASDLSSSEDDLLYELTLRLTDGAAIAERLLFLGLTPPRTEMTPPLPEIEGVLLAFDAEMECAGQWPCRDQFAAALSAAIESGEATLDHGQAVVIDLEGGTHGSEVHSVFQLYGIGASVSLISAEEVKRNPHTPDAFLELPAKKKQIVAHSVADLIAPAETLEEKDAIVAQAAANLYHPFPSFYRTTRRPDAPALITAAVETGLMVVVGGIAKTSERYELNSGYTEIDFDKRYTYKDYCDGTRKHKGTGGPPNVITLNGEEYCSVFDRCGWMQNYCLVAPAIDVVITETGQREEGTSYAAPQAAAALQMLGTMWPELSQRELALMLLELADDVGEQDHEGRDLGGIDHVYGHGALSFRRLYEPGGLSPFIVGDEIFRFSCDADANTCQKSPIENVDSENEENKQPPETIKVDLSSPISRQKPVLAAAESGTALLTVTVSNGGALSPFTDANGFASEGGALAVISLSRSATALFTLDGLMLSLALTATNAGGTVSETVSFASSARGFDGLGLSLHLTTALLRSETELFAAADARLTIWHNDGKKESYELSGLDSQLFAAGADGGVRVASDLPVSGEGAFYELTLRLTDGVAVAERLLFLRLTPPLPEIEGELLGETKLVNALSGSGTALLAVTVSNGGVLSPFADANGFASDGGAVAVISLARPATALFTLDGLTLSLALTATNAGGTMSATVSFASSSRGFDGLGLSLRLTTPLLRSGTELFAAADARLTIWHNDGKEENYELSGLDSQFFVTDADGRVRVASDLPVSGEGAFYELTLRLTDGVAVAERLLFLRLTPPLPEIEGELLGETKLVNALSGSGTALLTVTVSNGGALSPFANANGFASGGGAVAVILLARSATALFTLDGLTLSLALTATNAGGTVSETVSFVSSALGIDGAGLFASFATVMLPSETEVFAAADARLTIWHNGGKQETYELAGADASLFAVDANGGVRTASDLSSSEDDLLYELTLRLTDGVAIAERLLILALLPPPLVVDVECAGQWPCRDQFAAALSAAIESGKATLDHEQGVVIDLEGNTHGSEVRSAFQLYGSGASVSLTLAKKGNGMVHTPDAFLELPAKKKQIVAHSIVDLIAPAETLEEKDAIVAQSASNLYHPSPGFYRRNSRPDAPALITAAVETGLMVVVGGIAKTSERYRPSGRRAIDLNDPTTYLDYCDGRIRTASGSPPNVITLNGEEYCSIFDRCGWMQNYCLVAPARDVVIDAETDQRVDGTSFAAPQAAAALQMLSTMWPELSQRELALMLLELADDIGEQDHEGRYLGGIDHVYGHGALSFRRLYAQGGLSPFMAGGKIFRFSCDADANTCQKERL